jgi:hypothetical protein
VSGDNGDTSTATFDNFSFTNPAACEEGLGNPEEEVLPPGLTLCSDPLTDKGFEQSPSQWQLAFEQGVQRSPSSAHGGLFKLLAASDVGFPVNPWFYQGFIMQDFVISTTTAFQLEVSRNIFNMGNNQSGDQFYAVVTTNPSSIQNAINTKITTPTVVAQGVMPNGPYNPSKWDTIKVSLPIINPGTIENYKNQQLYLYFYNNSNATGACGGASCTTQFHFDDISLSPCTTVPLPPNIETRIKGNLTLHFSGGSTQKLPYVKVWAYTPGNSTIYETMTLPNGEFNFYNLPATPAGTNYVIFSQYHLVDAFDPTQIETLATQTSAVLRLNLHTNNSPQQVFLDLFTLDPTP